MFIQSEWMPLIPDSASTYSDKVDALYFYLIGVTIFFTLLISGALVYFALKYRRRSPFEIPRPIAGSIKLETLWSVIPFLIAISIFAWGADIFYEQYRPPQNAAEIYVVGKQWMWKIQHTTGQREINELHVPVGRKMRLIMTSEDVIHNFYVPAFRMKADVVPGRYTSQWFEATKPGRYHLFCAEYCGMNHSGMIGTVVVLEQTDFDRWLSGTAGDVTPAAAGGQLYEQLGCASCHGPTGEGGRGPALVGLFGREVLLESGQRVTANEDYIRESILNPTAKISAGFQPIMPTFFGQVTEEQLVQIVAFIKSLQIGGPGQSQAGNPATTSPAPPNQAPASEAGAQ